MQAIISQLRQEVDALQTEAGSRAGSSGRGADGHVSAELRRLREENSALRQQLKVLERSTRPSPGAEHADLERLGAETREVARELKLVRTTAWCHECLCTHCGWIYGLSCGHWETGSKDACHRGRVGLKRCCCDYHCTFCHLNAT